MAQMLIVAATAVLTTVGVPGAVASTIATIGVNAAITAGVNAIGQALAGKERAEGSATAFRLDTDAGIPFPFGTVGVGGTLAYRKGFGATNRYQALVSTLAGAGPIKSYVSFAADDEITTFGANDVATSGDHAGAMWLQRKLGAQPQTALTSPTGLEGSVTAPNWTSDHKMSGRAVVMWTLFENSKMSEYKGGIPKPLHVIEGKYGWDPREDSTYPGGSGSCRLLTPSTWVWIDNPAIAALNWSIGMWEGDSGGGLYGVPYACSLVGGIGSSLAGIDVAAFVNAANVADANNWIIAAYPSTKDDKYAVLTNMLQAAGAIPSRKAGKISCITNGEEQASILSVTATDTAGPVEVSLGQSRLERINTVLPRYWSPEHRWEMTQAAPVTDAAWVTEDGGKRSRGFDYPYVPSADQAAQLAYYDIANAREPVSGTVPFKPHMRRIEPGDCFTFDEPGFLLDGIKVKCQRRSYDPMSGIVKITFRQETDSKHADAIAETGTPPPDVVADAPPVYADPPSEPPVTVDDPSPITASTGSISVSAFNAVLTDGTAAAIGSDTITGLSNSTNYGVFWREDVGIEVEAYPAETRHASGGYTFLGWAETPDGSGAFAAPTATPAGFAGTGQAPDRLGTLAKSALTEAQVQGRYFGEHAGDAAANTAGLQDGDVYVDTSITPSGFKVKSGGVITEVDTAGLFGGSATQQDVTSTTLANFASVSLSGIQANSYVTVWAIMLIELTPGRTRKSGGTAGVNPSGTL